uniref:Probable ATP-dependent RNA helicase spindle-E n=1 Tax=Cacopsylla melanoneura TaxID=428564 RepID=A0A8D9FFL9_9HEMI
MAGFANIFSMMENTAPININVGQGYKFLDENSLTTIECEEPFVSTLQSGGKSYADEIKEQEEDDWKKQMLRLQAASLSDCVSIPDSTMSSIHLEDITTIGTHAAPVDDLAEDENYSQFDWKKKTQQVLPIDAHKSQLLKLVTNHVVSIIKGATGCGKSTQLPLYILEEFKNKRKPVQIVVTQPRRIAAVSVAERVCRERNWRVGDLVGYQIGQNKVASDYTKLLFCTTGVLLHRLVKQKSIDNINYIILDEVHERDKDMDFLMIVIKKLMRSNAGKTHIVLMSATLDSYKLSKYFSHWSQSAGSFQSARIHNITAHHPHVIHKFFLEQFQSVEPTLYRKLPTPSLSKPGITSEQYQYVCSLVSTFDRLEASEAKKVCGSVLIFLPGIHEITEMHSALDEFMKSHNHNLSKLKKPQIQWKVFVLHSSIPKEQQDLVFSRPPPDMRKIVLSTNIAESSITVSDVKYVVDFCLTKVLTVAEGSNYSSLQLEWASESSCQQRAGRVGRVSEGRVYYMITSDFYNQLPVEDTPEMLRSPLDSLVLHAKMLDMGEPVHIFGLAMDPPDIGNIKRTILSLKEIGALFPTSNGEYRDDDGDITFMGEVMSSLPVDPRVAKLIYLGYIFNVLEDTVIMAAAMSVKNPFSSPYREEMDAYCSKLIWADSTCSDLIAFLNLYKVWHGEKARGFFDRSRGPSEKMWARQNFVQLSSLREIEKLVTDIMNRLRHHEMRTDPENVPADHERPIILKIIIGGAFYPNYFFRGKESGQIDEKDALKTLGGHDPMNTVYLRGLPSSQLNLVPLYANEIKQHMTFCPPSDMKILADSSKVFIQFKDQTGRIKTGNHHNEKIPGKVNNAVFKAIKMRQIVSSVTIKCYRENDGLKKIEEMGLANKKDGGAHSAVEGGSLLKPGGVTRYINIRIIYVENLSRFWAQNTDRHHELVDIHRLINIPENLVSLPNGGTPPRIGTVCAAPFSDRKYYRAKVLAVKGKMVLVKYIDYGNEKEVPLSELRLFGPTLKDEDLSIRKPFAFECSLAEVTPSIMLDHHGLWSPQAIQWFKDNFLNSMRALSAEIYSIVDGIVKIILFDSDFDTHGDPVNKKLIDIGYAAFIEEHYRSKLDHDNRIRELFCEGLDDIEDDEADLAAGADYKDDGRKKITVSLVGPFSPLETSVYAPVQAVCMKPVHIDRESVNCVLLDTEPQDSHQRLLVSAFATANATSEFLKVRETTLMPNIPGLPALLCLVFAPQVELRADKDRTKVMGALCGLGYRMSEEGKFEALYAENDMEIAFDIQVKNKFLTLVNGLRLFLDKAVSEEPADITDIRTHCKQLLLQLLLLPIDPSEMDFYPRRFRWGQIRPEFLLNPKNYSEETHPSQLTAHVYHLIWGILLAPKAPESINTTLLYSNLREMANIADGVTPMKNSVFCELCKTHVDDHQTLRVHLSTRRHNQHIKWLQSIQPPPQTPSPYPAGLSHSFYPHFDPQGKPGPPGCGPPGQTRSLGPPSRPMSRNGPPSQARHSSDSPGQMSRGTGRPQSRQAQAGSRPQSRGVQPSPRPPHGPPTGYFEPVQPHGRPNKTHQSFSTIPHPRPKY